MSETLTAWCDADDGGKSFKLIPVPGGLYTYPCGCATAFKAKHETTMNVFILHTINDLHFNDQLQ